MVCQEDYWPHSSQSQVITTNIIPIRTSFTLGFIRHERTESKLQLRHIARELQFTTFPERFGYWCMQHECLDDILDNGYDPEESSFSDMRRKFKSQTDHSCVTSAMSYWLIMSVLIKLSFSTKSFMYGLGPPPIAIVGSAVSLKFMRWSFAMIAPNSRRIADIRGSTRRSKVRLSPWEW